MKKLITFMFFLVSVTAFYAQTPIEVTDQTLKIDAISEEILYFGFEEGDQILFSFTEANGKELKELEILEYPDNSKFSDFKTSKIENKTIYVNKQSVYAFRFYNSSLGGRVCKIKIQRIPESEDKKKFNSNVYWRTIRDTIYKPKEELYLVKSDTISKDVYSSNPQISSQNALNGNLNYQVIDFLLPENTISWSFYIGTGDEGKKEFERARTEFLESSANQVSKLPGYGVMGALALYGVSYFTKIQGEDNVKYWFLSDIESVKLFQSGQPFYSYKKGDVINEFSQMTSPLKGKIYLALLNDNIAEPIILTIKANAIIVDNQWGKRIVQEIEVNEWEEPFLKN